MQKNDKIPVMTDSITALRYRDFRIYIGTRFFFTFAYQMQTVIIGFYIYHLTKSVFLLGLFGLFEAIPAITIALYGGYIADKSEKRKMLLCIYMAILFCSIIMFSVTLTGVSIYVSRAGVIRIIFFLIFCNGIARAFLGPANFTIYADSLPKEAYANGNSWNSTARQAGSILGPAAGGIVYGYFGITAALGLIVLFILIALVIASFLKKFPPVFTPKDNLWKSLAEGIQFVFRNKMMLGAMSLDLFSVFFGGFVALLPVFANDILKVGPQGLGIMRAASSAGAILVMLLMTKYSLMNRPWRNLLLAITGFGLSIVCFGFSKNFYLSLFLLFASGGFDSINMLIRGTIMQLLTPDAMRGRVSAVTSMFIDSSNEIGDFESGTLAGFIGTVPTVILGGCMTLTVVIITYCKTKKYIPFSLEDIHPKI
ncbi:MFS transporter [Pedobacter caeni]|uniref:Multidrug efflux pump Tap n=1 Tax=Pedobacter caeni TaxID=288992 RepID=A0A1M5KW50_9SPHI|nr:MFS transporter [Pedobacter caeni]SHG57082.1 Transmembrane secretion effector [Pedobacter caeni]